MSAFFRSPRDKAKAGFTIVELMIVITIFGVLAAVGVPAYLQWLPDIRLKAAVRDLKSDMEISKLRAIRENADVVIWFDTNNDTYTAYLDNGAGTGTPGDHWQNGTEPTIINGEMPAGVDMYETLFSSWANQTIFDGRGLPSGGWGYVHMVNSKSSYKGILLNLAGHAQIQTSTDGGTWVDES